MIRRSTILGILFALFFVSFVSAQSTESPSGKYAYVDTLTLLSYAPQRRAVEGRLRLEEKKMQDSLAPIKSELAELKRALDAETDVAKKDKLRQQVLDKQTLVTRRTEASQEAFLLKRNDEIAAFQALIVAVIAETAKQKNLDAVLTQASVVYVNPRIDITDDIMAVLKSRHELSNKQTSGRSNDSTAPAAFTNSLTVALMPSFTNPLYVRRVP